MQMELDLQLEDRGAGAIEGSLDFSTDLYTSESANRIAGHLQVRGFLPTLSQFADCSWLSKCRCQASFVRGGVMHALHACFVRV